MNRTSPSRAALTLTAALAASPALADVVTVTSVDGEMSITGELLGVEEGAYVMSTTIGVFRLGLDEVTCDGAACPAPEAEDDGRFVLAGSRALADTLMPALLRSYAARSGGGQMLSPDPRTQAFMVGEGLSEPNVFLTGSDTRAGLDKLYDGEADLALASRPVRTEEQRDFAQAGKGFLRSFDQESVIALDGLVFAVHPENPVRALGGAEAARVLAGEVTNWSELGGPDAPITVYARAAGTGTREALDALVMEPAGRRVTATGMRILSDDAAVAAAVLEDETGLGFTSFSRLGAARALDVEGACGLRSAPTAHAIRTEEYPLTQLLYAYRTNGKMPASGEAMLEFVGTAEGQATIAEAGFVNHDIARIPLDAQGLRIASAVISSAGAAETAAMRDMVRRLMESDRLSTTLRFQPDSTRLTNRSQADLDRLAAMIEGADLTGKEVLFVGFTDSVGRADLNRALSEQRAEAVRRTLLSRHPGLADAAITRAVGYGEISPQACNETEAGRQANRRVEIWLQDVAETPAD